MGVETVNMLEQALIEHQMGYDFAANENDVEAMHNHFNEIYAIEQMMVLFDELANKGTNRDTFRELGR